MACCASPSSHQVGVEDIGGATPLGNVAIGTEEHGRAINLDTHKFKSEEEAQARPVVSNVQGRKLNFEATNRASIAEGQEQRSSTTSSGKDKPSNSESVDSSHEAAPRRSQSKDQPCISPSAAIHPRGKDSHGHKEKPLSLVAAFISALINYMLMFGLCCAYGMIMFSGANVQFAGLGVKMNVFTAFIAGALIAAKCGCRVAIGGPDLNPVVFIGDMIVKIAQDIAEQLDLEYPKSNHRRLAQSSGGSPSWWCQGQHRQDNAELCDEYGQQLCATVIFAVAASSAALGLAFFLSGRLNLTRYASYVPTCVMEAFLSCVGYKVFDYALYFCDYDVKQFVPAAAVGVPLYFFKANHIGNPAIVIPVFLLLPLAIFYGIVYGGGNDLDSVGEWMFPEKQNIEFWKIWTLSVGAPGKINFTAWLTTMPDLVIMIVVCFMDCLLKLLGTEAKLPIKVDKDREMQLFGACNLFTTLGGSPVGYMQLKFNMINAGILGNIQDRRAGLIYALMCGCTFFSSIEHFNYLPRFFLGTLLFFAGTGFVAENLWGSRKYLSLGEWLQILLIVAVFIISKALLYAVLAGLLLTCLDFIRTYAAVPCVVEPPVRRSEVSCVRRSPMAQRSLDHIINQWLLVVRLKGFIFFASAQTLVAQIQELMGEEERAGVPQYQRLRFIIFDCAHMDGMDSSTAKLLRKLWGDAHHHRVTILWAHVDKEFEATLRTQELLHNHHQSFADIDEALYTIERYTLTYISTVQERFTRLHPSFAEQHELSRARDEFEPFKDVFMEDAFRHGCPWRYCSGVAMKRFCTLLWSPKQTNVGLYLVHRGAVALFQELPDPDAEHKSWPSPVAVYTQGWFLNRESLIYQPTRYYAVAFEDGELMCWTKEQWRQMDLESPRMASEIARAVMKQQATDGERMGGCQTMIGYVPEMFKRVRALRVARALGDQKLYEKPSSDSASYLPPLPPTLKRDLRTAFNLFCVGVVRSSLPRQVSSSRLFCSEQSDEPTAFRSLARQFSPMGLIEGRGEGEQQNAFLPTDKVNDALMFAGIFGTPPAFPEGTDSLTLKDFLLVAQEAAMLRLSPDAVSFLRATFKEYDEDESGFLDDLELANVFSKLFLHRLEAEELAALLAEWADQTASSMDESKFIAVFSRFARVREQDWNLWVGLQEVVGGVRKFGSKRFNTRTAVDEMMLMAAAPDLTEEQASEMLWLAGRRKKISAKDADKSPSSASRSDRCVCDFFGLMCAVLMPPAKVIPRQTLEERMPAFFLPSDLPTAVNSGKLELTISAIWNTTRKEELKDIDNIPQPLQHDGFELEISEYSSEPETVAEQPFTIRQQIYSFMEEATSKRAQTYGACMALLAVLSVLPWLIMPFVDDPLEENDALFFLDLGLTIVFLGEYIVRASVATAYETKTMKHFFFSPLNLCDLMAIMPFFIELAVDNAEDGGFRLLRVLRILRLSRMAKVAQLTRRFQIVGPVVAVTLVILFIYLQTAASDSK